MFVKFINVGGNESPSIEYFDKVESSVNLFSSIFDGQLTTIVTISSFLATHI